MRRSSCSARFRPLSWPLGVPRHPNPNYRETGDRFRSDYDSTVRLLSDEVAALGGKEFIVEADFRERDIRLDGLPRADARTPDDPAVVVSFDSEDRGSLRYPCDFFLDWKANLRAIALTLERLRSVDRYGVAGRGEQYAGWRALPAAHAGSESMSETGALAIIRRYSGLPVTKLDASTEGLSRILRAARREAHPDRHGGDDRRWKKLETAIAVLGLNVKRRAS